jgi:truncated hemoglobin YjbI
MSAGQYDGHKRDNGNDFQYHKTFYISRHGSGKHIKMNVNTAFNWFSGQFIYIKQLTTSYYTRAAAHTAFVFLKNFSTSSWNIFQHSVLLIQWVGTSQHKTKRRGHTPMPPLEFEPTIPVFQREIPTHYTARSVWSYATSSAAANKSTCYCDIAFTSDHVFQIHPLKHPSH